jgi:heptosyltransferase-2/heptosyltransferase-3
MPKPSSRHLPAPEEIRKVLVIRPRFVGDVCLTLPVVAHLKRLAPQAELHYLVEEEAAPLLAGDPRLTRVWVASRHGSPLAGARLAGELRGVGFDLVLDLFCNPRTALWTAATGAPWRVGYPGKRMRSAAYNVPVRTDAVSAVAFHLASLEALGWPTREEVPALALSAAEKSAAWNHLAERGIPAGAELVGMHPGARFMTRRWQPEDFAALGRTLLAHRPRARLLVFGGPGEEELARSIAGAVGDPRVQPIVDTALRRFAALVSLCRAFVGGDSGPIHVAVAAGTPTVGIFGRNAPDTFFPYPESHGHRAIYARVWCSPCHLDVCDHLSCLRAISPEWVWEVLRTTLERAGRGEFATTPVAGDANAAAGPVGPVPTAALGARPKPAPSS